MDVLLRSRQNPAELFAYVENKKIFDIFQNMLERLSVDRPENHVEYLYNLLLKEAVHNVPKVYVLGPATIDRTLTATVLDLKLGLTHVTYESLFEDANEGSETADIVTLIKDRLEKPDCARKGWILEGLPKTRTEAFLLRKAGVFPTHIVFIEPYDLPETSEEDMSDETQDFLAHETLILDIHRNSYSKKFIVNEDINDVIEKVLTFVRSKKQPPMPYLPRVLLLGPYGSGRKTVARKLSDKYNLVEVNFQQELRKAAMKSSPIKDKICEKLQSTSPIPDDVLVEVASERLMQKDCVERGWVMYYFPDTENQARLLAKSLEGFQINRAIFLNTSLQNCLDRVEPRRIDPNSGIVYHMKLNPCESRIIRDRLIQLPHDAAEIVEAEFRFFEQNAQQLKIFFQQNFSDDISTEIDADQSEYETFEAVQGAILKSTKMKFTV